ncbi:hypothetical protein KC340_g103 [Hortaea werneckii]|nr:hypothetical protein KC340_g103 [Hortaea werneckii]
MPPFDVSSFKANTEMVRRAVANTSEKKALASGRNGWGNVTKICAVAFGSGGTVRMPSPAFRSYLATVTPRNSAKGS